MGFTTTASKRLILATAIAGLFGTIATPALADMETLLDKLHEKGVLSDDDYQEMRTEARADRRAQALKEAKEEEKKQQLTKINRFHITQLAYFLKKLQSVPEGETTLLDNSMIIYGSGIGDGNIHNHDNLPVVLAGRGAGSLTPGRHWKLDGKVPMANLYLAMLERMGVQAAKLGDSTGKLENL